MKVLNYLLILPIFFCAAACSDDDDPKDGPVSADSITDLDCTDYGAWTYVNLKTGETKVYADDHVWVYSDGTEINNAPVNVDMDWHIAIHRYEVRTNGGSAYDSGVTDMDAITNLPEGEYKADEVLTDNDDLSITVDLSRMMTDRVVGYAKDASVNKVLCSWVTRTDTGSMPPTIYTPTNHVLVLKNSDGSWAKLQFTVAGNTETGTSGYVSFNYEFFD